MWLYAFVAAAQPKPTYITDGRYSSFEVNDCEKVHRLTDSSSSPFQHLKSGPSQRQPLLLRTGSSHLTAHHPPLSHPPSLQTNPLLPALIRLPFVPSLPILFPKPSNPLPPLFPQRAKTRLPPLTSSQIQTTGMMSNHIPPQPHVTQKPLPPLANDRRSPPRFAVPPLIPPSPFKNNLIFKLFPSRTCSANPNHRTFNPSTATHLSGLALSLIG